MSMKVKHALALAASLSLPLSAFAQPTRVGAGSGAAMPPDHPPLAAKAAEGQEVVERSEADLLRELDAMPDLPGRDKPFEVAQSLGKLYYAHGRYSEAAVYLGQAVEKGEPARKLWLEQSKRAKAQKLDLPTAAEAGCADETASVEDRTARAAELAKAKQTGPSATCARLAVRPVMEQRNLLTAAQYLAGDSDAALKTAEGTLEATPDDADALYYLASILLETRGDDLAALKRVKAGFDRVAELRPMTERARWMRRLGQRVDEAIAAGGVSKLAATARQNPHAQAGLPADHPPMAAIPSQPAAVTPPQLSQETMEAFQKVERTPELLAQLAQTVETAEVHLAKGQFEDALNAYRTVMPLQPDNGRVRAGLAWAMLKLNRQPMADNVWNVAVQGDPKAVDALGERLKSLGDGAGAKAVWGKLAQSDANYAKSANLAGRMQ